jgi:hypothetical protein
VQCAVPWSAVIPPAAAAAAAAAAACKMTQDGDSPLTSSTPGRLFYESFRGAMRSHCAAGAGC